MPASQACILTSAEKHLALSVSNSIQQIADEHRQGRPRLLQRQANDGIGVSPFYDAASKLPADIQAKLDAALAGMKDGSVVTCPPAPKCGKTPGAADRQPVRPSRTSSGSVLTAGPLVVSS